MTEAAPAEPTTPRAPGVPAVTLDVLPARRGDCLWLELAAPGGVKRVLVDGGTPATARLLRARLEALPEDDRRFEVVVVSHIDSDHIGGVLGLLADPPAGLSIGDIWFNGLRHLGPAGRSVAEAERLSDLMAGQPDRLWNQAFASGPVATAAEGDSVAVDFDWGLRMTVLSPTVERLARLRPAWQEAVADARAGRASPTEPQARVRAAAPSVEELAAHRSQPDRALPNGSSIALLAEFGGVSLLLAADAFADVLAPAVAELARRRGGRRLAVDAFKLPHHGSEGNVLAPLLEAVRCRQYVFSTDGSMFQHPDPPAVARTILGGGAGSTLLFNHRTPRTRRWWADEAVQEQYRYHVRYPEEAGAGLRLTF